MSPTPIPSNANATYVTSNDFDVANIAHAMMCGMFTNNIARRRPNGSVSKPEKMLPTGCPMNDTLAEWFKLKLVAEALAPN